MNNLQSLIILQDRNHQALMTLIALKRFVPKLFLLSSRFITYQPGQFPTLLALGNDIVRHHSMTQELGHYADDGQECTYLRVRLLIADGTALLDLRSSILRQEIVQCINTWHALASALLVRYAKAMSVYEVAFEYRESNYDALQALQQVPRICRMGMVHNLNCIPKHDSYAILDR